MSTLRVAVIVSKDKSDLYFANQLMQQLNVVGVMVENQRLERDMRPLYVKAIKYFKKPHVFVSKMIGKIAEIFRHKFADYHKPEYSVDFGDEGKRLFPTDNVSVVYTEGANNLNAPEYVDWLARLRPDIVAVCGASILREQILSIPKYGTLNLHGGLSQRYRGLFTTDWAIHNEEPEYVGATVHYVSPGIDDGDIVYQGRPHVEVTDNPHSLYEKIVKLGVKMMSQAISDIEKGMSKQSKLTQKGSLYLARMYDNKAMDRTWRKVKKGVIKAYLANREERDAPVRKMMVNVFPESN